MGLERASLQSVNAPVKSILKELIVDARQRKSKSSATLCQAYRSLKSNPISFINVHQLLPLEGFSAALIAQLELKLCEWCDSHGKEYPHRQNVASTSARKIDESCDSDMDGETDSDLEVRAPAKRSRSDVAEKVRSHSTTKPVSQKAKAPKEKAPKTFVPQHRTGSHGILVSLYTLTPQQPGANPGEDTEADTNVSYLSKSTIIHFAQPFSDSKYIPKQSPASFSGGFGASYHSAWSGMKTLINRGYVYRRGNPAGFGLSHEGWEVAATCTARESDKLKAGCNLEKARDIHPSISSQPVEKASKRKGATAGTTQDASNMPFLYSYLTETDPPQQTTIRSEASIHLCDTDFRMLYRIAFARTLQSHPFVKSCVRDVIEKEADLLSGWVKEAACNETAPGIHSASVSGFSNEAMAPQQTAKSTSGKQKAKRVRPPLQPVKPPREEEQVLPKSSQIEVVELLTSSDWEGDKPTCFESRMLCRDDQESDSDSALSDLAPRKKVVKRRR